MAKRNKLLEFWTSGFFGTLHPEDHLEDWESMSDFERRAFWAGKARGDTYWAK